MEDPFAKHTEASGSFQSSDVLSTKHVMPSADPLDEDLRVALSDASRVGLVAFVAITASAIVGINLALPAYFVWGIVMGLITVVDFEQLRVPNRFVGFAAVVMYPLLAVASLSSLSGTSLSRAIAGSFVLLLGYLALHLFAPSSLGMGDVKLAFVIGGHLGFLGWGSLYYGTLAAFAAMAIVGVGLIVLRRANRRSGLPFAPFMILGALIAIGLTVRL